MIGKSWIQPIALVMLFGFMVSGTMAYRTYTAFFQARGLQEYGSVLGHGALSGHDTTAEYLKYPAAFAWVR